MLGQRDLAGADHIATAAFDAIEGTLLLRTRPLFTTDLAQQQLRQQLRRTRLCAGAAEESWHFGAGVAQVTGRQSQPAIAGQSGKAQCGERVDTDGKLAGGESSIK